MRDSRIYIETAHWPEVGDALAVLRRAVFVAEQGISASEEFDGRDAECTHLAAWRDLDEAGDQRELVGTARLDPSGRIGRMAVRADCRSHGAGSLLLRYALQEAYAAGLPKASVHAQARAAAFYYSRGFLYDGEEFEEAGLPHHPMVYRLDGRVEPIASAFEYGDEFRRQIHSNIAAFDHRTREGVGKRRAGVALVVVANDAGQACFVLTKRQAKLRRHGGQWALPGGRVDEGETAIEAAIRELHEEVGLQVSNDAVLGVLDDYETHSGFVITPVVIWAPADAVLIADPVEVAGIYKVPLTVLEHPQVPQLRSIPESERPVVSLPILGTKIHAPTAALLYQLREVAVHGRETRVNGLEQPVFAWR